MSLKDYKGVYIPLLNALGLMTLFHLAAATKTPGCDVFQVTKCVDYTVPCNATWEFKRYNYHRGDFGCYTKLAVEGTVTDIDVVELNSNYFGSRDINSLMTKLTITGKIHTVMRNTFQAMVLLEELSLTNCGIEEIKAEALNNLIVLSKVDLSHNAITKIDQSTFRITGENKIKSLNLSHNKLQVLNVDMLLPLGELKELHLENNLITEIVSTNNFSSGLISLYLQHNLLNDVNQRGIAILRELEQIDLSYNEIVVMEYNNFENCQKLTDVDLSYNKIIGTFNATFLKNLNISKVNLSGNKINNISKNAFSHLSLKHFTISGNDLTGELGEATFEGLLKVEDLDLSSQNITRIGRRAFTGAPNLITLNIRNNLITELDNYCFDSLTKLKSLDISHNNISRVDFDTSSLYNVQTFYARNNKISKIEYNSLKNMKSLRILDVRFNDLKHFDAISNINFQYLETFRFSNNHLTEFPDFDVNSLIEIDAGYNNINKIQLEKSNTSSFKVFKLVGNNITILTIPIKICRDSLEFLDISLNSLTTIDQNLLGHNLLYFNASFNNIAELLPGQFMVLNNLKLLNLSHNKISELPYGVFNGLDNISTLDLSYNRIKTIDESLLHPVQHLNSLILDYNLIKSLNVFDLIDHLNISKLSIGGNQIPCYFLAKVIQIGKKQNFTNVIDSIHKRHLAENINGILCDYTHPEHENVIKGKSNVTEINKKQGSLISAPPAIVAAASAHSGPLTAVEGCFICLVIICVLMAGKTVYRFYLNKYANSNMHVGLELMEN